MIDVLAGAYLMKPTGKVDADNPQYIELIDPEGAYRMARPCYSFGFIYGPSEDWLTRYKDEILIATIHEQGSPDHLLWFGYVPLDGKLTDTQDFPEKCIFRTKEFMILFNDKDSVLEIIRRDAQGTILERLVIKKDKIFLEAKTVHLGSENAAEPILLGDTLITMFSDTLTAVNALTVPTPLGPSGTPINFVSFDTIKSKLNDAKSKVSKTD